MLPALKAQASWPPLWFKWEGFQADDYPVDERAAYDDSEKFSIADKRITARPKKIFLQLSPEAGQTYSNRTTIITL